MSESELRRRRDEFTHLQRRSEQEIREITQERDQARRDKKNVESANADVQEKFERVLKTLISLKEKEEQLIARSNERQDKLARQEREMEEYKESARIEVESEYHNWLTKLAEAEATNVRLKAMIRKSEMKVGKLEHELSQKKKENDQLHDLCDDLIHKNPKKTLTQD